MKTNKYNFHEDLKPYENQKTILIPFVVSILQKLMGILYLKEKSDDEIDVKTVKVSDKNTSIRTLIYESKTCQDNCPCIYFIHGGGFVFNAAPHHFSLARRLTKELNCKTILVDYRLAPKYKFPSAPNDCLIVYEWLLNHAHELNIDPRRIIVCGDSAGGNLATVLCLMAKEKLIQMPKAQMLLYPVTDCRMLTESCKLFTDTPMCNSEDMKKYLAMYVKGVDETNLAYLSPMEVCSLKNLPQAYIEVAQYDCLHDEGVNYAYKLENDGVHVELHEIKEAMHGYDIAENSNFMQDILKQRIEFLKKI